MKVYKLFNEYSSGTIYGSDPVDAVRNCEIKLPTIHKYSEIVQESRPVIVGEIFGLLDYGKDVSRTRGDHNVITVIAEIDGIRGEIDMWEDKLAKVAA